MAGKRARPGKAAAASSNKKQRTLDGHIKNDAKPNGKASKSESPISSDVDGEPAYIQQVHGKIATAENAARVDASPPLGQLQSAIAEHKNDIKNPAKGDSVLYWMRMEDMRGLFGFNSVPASCSLPNFSQRQPSAFRSVQHGERAWRSATSIVHAQPGRLRFP
ncbi:hypothetical protein FRC12_009064 [Ceratobasidium sp. 428]|nr:hypothetical protein FRC12_009064 [Ceratobasidium sp. 428]